MPPSVAFLRAVNLGSRRKVAMADLRRELEDLGLDEVSTYINSGNAVFSTSRRGRALEEAIEARLEAAFGFPVPTYVRTVRELRELLAAEPFPVGPGDTYQIVFLHRPPPAAVCRALAGLSTDTDELAVVGRELHWRVTGTLADSTVPPAALARVLDVPTTARTATMLRKLGDRLP